MQELVAKQQKRSFNMTSLGTGIIGSGYFGTQ